MKDTRCPLLNVLLFVIGWFASVIGGDNVAVPVTALILLVHFSLITRVPGEWRLVIQVATLGFAFDSILLATEILQIDQQGRMAAPLWMVCLWALFATLILNSLDWLRRYWQWAPLLGVIVGPTAYYAGCQLSGVALRDPHWQALLIIAMAWAVFLPLLVWMGRQIRESAGLLV